MSKISDERLDSLEAIIHELAGDVASGGPEDRAWAIINELRSGGEEKNGVDHIADAGKMILVPVEPTREMWAAAANEVCDLQSRGIGHHDIISEAVYTAMLSAAPQPANTDLSLRAENERLRKIIWDGEASMWGVHEKGFVMGPLIHRPSIGQIIADLKAKLEEAAKVLEPIVAVIEASEVHARLNGNDPDAVPDTHEVTPYKDVPNVTLGHLRALKSFLANLKGAE